MRFYPRTLLKLMRQSKPMGLSLRRRLTVYLAALTCGTALMIFLALYMLGAVNSTDQPISAALSNRLDDAAKELMQDMDTAAACGTMLSEALSEVLQSTLSDKGISFDQLSGNAEALLSVQRAAYGIMLAHMRLAPCSGAFYMIDATASTVLPNAQYSGLYLKYADLYAENTMRNKVCMFRGSYAVARENQIGLYSTWQPEMSKGTFAQAEDMMRGSVNARYMLTDVYPLPDSWERARLICLPIYMGGRIAGVCGFELSDLYFCLSYAGEDGNMVCALLTNSDGAWQGQTSGNICAANQSAFSISSDGRYSQIATGSERFIGLTRELKIGDSTHFLAAMLPGAQYEQLVHGGNARAAGALLGIMIVAAGVCAYLSRRYVAPILHSLAQLKARKPAYDPSNIPEIDDLFELLAAKERDHEQELQLLRRSREDMQRECERAEHTLSTLYASGMQEFDPDECAHFSESLNTLTPREREIFELYLQGKTGKDIQSLLNINQNTIKYHNKNIYDKLGVHSRKELLKYAALTQANQLPRGA